MNEKYITYVQEKLDMRTKAEALVEELAELQQATLKLIRAYKLSDNSTPISIVEANANFKEELCDVLMTLDVMANAPVEDMQDWVKQSNKWERWANRLGYKEE